MNQQIKIKSQWRNLSQLLKSGQRKVFLPRWVTISTKHFNFKKPLKIYAFKGYDSKLIRDTWCSEYILDEGIMDLLRRLKEQNYRIISYTDGIPERVTYVENKYNFRHHFDAEVHSYEWQAVKTDMVFARALLHMACCETNPGELLLIDDQAHETKLVKELGVNILIYKTGFLDKLVDDLRNIGVQC